LGFVKDTHVDGNGVRTFLEIVVSGTG